MTKMSEVEDHLPEFMTFVRQMSAAHLNGDFAGWDDIVARVEAFFGPRNSAQMEALIPGWQEMASYFEGRTQTHTVCVLIALYGLPEFRAAAPEEKLMYEWIGLLHDIAKKQPAKGFREQTHAFMSAAQAAPILASSGFPTRPGYEETVAGWQAYTRSATLMQTGLELADNSKLPRIIAGIDRMFGAASPAARILKTILFHLSFSWIQDWPAAAPLSDDEIRRYINPLLLDSLIVMALMDTEAWSLFDDSPREGYRLEILSFEAETLRLITESWQVAS